MEELGAAVAIKWPNDLLLGGKKLGGILTELHVGRPKTFVVVGLGLNLASAPELPDGALVAASLAQLPGGPPDREALTAALRERLLAVVERFDEGGFAAVRPDWERRWRHKGRSVRADLPGGRSVEGIAIALDDDGALLLDTGGATPVRVTVGDVNACC